MMAESKSDVSNDSTKNDSKQNEINSSEADPSTGSFASQGGYGPGPMGRGPYNQPYTYSTSKEADVGISELDTAETPEEVERLQRRADASNKEGQRPRTVEQERIEHLGEAGDESPREAPRVPTDTWTED
jgi:hypothetical protein